jgi:hypothetical protein
MPTIKKTVRAKESTRCDFCKCEIKKGEAHVRSRVLDNFGSYTLRRHKHCERTAALNRVAAKVNFDV